MTNCIICGFEIPETQWDPPNQPRFDCPVCGRFKLSELAAQRLYEARFSVGQMAPPFLGDHHLLSAAIRQIYEDNAREEVFIPDFEIFRGTARPLKDPFEAVDRILKYVVKVAERVGDEVPLLPTTDYPIAFARDADEFRYFVRLSKELALMEVKGDFRVRPLSAGWKRLAEIALSGGLPSSAFVAMPFVEDLREAYTLGIEPALRAAGFEAIRVDLIQHNGKIDDRIIADIRHSALLIADFTGHRQNVYFEAGFAYGLGRHVIFTCRSGDIDEAHFDTRQYNHIVWSSPENLREQLFNRINATIPRPVRALPAV
jgi:hypothetical protein